MGNTSLDVAVILVNWNGWRDTLECLDSLAAMRSPGRMHIVITDNLSSDDSVQRISAWMDRFNQPAYIDMLALGASVRERVAEASTTLIDDRVTVTLICNKDNGGFAVGNNLGMALADTVFGVGYFWVLNNDTVVKVDTLELLVSKMESDRSIGICGSALVFHHDSSVVQAYGGVRYSYWSGRGWHIGGGEPYRAETGTTEVESAMTYVSGASMLVSLDFYQQIGPMSEDFFLYNEELDWAWRGRKRFRLGCEPRSVVMHKEGASIGTVSVARNASPLSEFYQARNKLKFTVTRMPWFAPTVWLFLAAKALRLYLLGHRRNARVIAYALLGKQTPVASWAAGRASAP